MNAMRFPISANGNIFGPNDQVPENPRWTEALIASHQKDLTFCQCSGNIPLVVKRYSAGQQTVKFGLARWPDTGLDHNLDCQFFTEDESDTPDPESAFENLSGGQVRAYLDSSLTRTVKKGNASEFIKSLKPNPKRPNAERIVRERASDSMLLLKLWREARLNIFNGRNRVWFHATFAIINAAKRIIINRNGETLADYLYINSSTNDKLVTKHNETVLAHVARVESRMYVIGRMKESKTEKLQTILPMIGVGATMPKALISTEMLAEAIGTGNFKKNMLHAQTGNLIGFAAIEPTGPVWWKCVSLVTIPTSANMIPVSSSAEIEFEAYLTANGRTFVKPIHVSAAPSPSPTPLNPEFVLLDTEERFRFQLWGTRSECSLAEIDAAMVAKDSHKSVSHWSANPREKFPDLPDIFKANRAEVDLRSKSSVKQ